MLSRGLLALETRSITEQAPIPTLTQIRGGSTIPAHIEHHYQVIDIIVYSTIQNLYECNCLLIGLIVW